MRRYMFLPYLATFFMIISVVLGAVYTPLI
jgi:hypothetical protein